MNNSRALIVIVLSFYSLQHWLLNCVDIQIVKSEELKYYAQKTANKY